MTLETFVERARDAFEHQERCVGRRPTFVRVQVTAEELEGLEELIQTMRVVRDLTLAPEVDEVEAMVADAERW